MRLARVRAQPWRIANPVIHSRGGPHRRARERIPRRNRASNKPARLPTAWAAAFTYLPLNQAGTGNTLTRVVDAPFSPRWFGRSASRLSGLPSARWVRDAPAAVYANLRTGLQKVQVLARKITNKCEGAILRPATCQRYMPS